MVVRWVTWPHLIIVVFSLSQMRMMLLGSSSYPFSTLESVLYKTLFVRPLNFSALRDLTQSCASQNASDGATSTRPHVQNTDQSESKESANGKKTNWVLANRKPLLLTRTFSKHFLLMIFYLFFIFVSGSDLMCTYFLFWDDSILF